MKSIRSVLKIFANSVGLLWISVLISSCKNAVDIRGMENISPLSIDSLKVLPSNIPSAMYADLTFLNLQNGFAISQGNIVKTSDRGITWGTIPTPVSVSLMKIQFTSNDTGYILGG